MIAEEKIGRYHAVTGLASFFTILPGHIGSFVSLLREAGFIEELLIIPHFGVADSAAHSRQATLILEGFGARIRDIEID